MTETYLEESLKAEEEEVVLGAEEEIEDMEEAMMTKAMSMMDLIKTESAEKNIKIYVLSVISLGGRNCKLSRRLKIHFQLPWSATPHTWSIKVKRSKRCWKLEQTPSSTSLGM